LGAGADQNQQIWNGNSVSAPDKGRARQYSGVLRGAYSRIKSDLIQDGNSCIFALLIQLQHCRRNVTGCDNILLVPDRRLDDGRVESVWDQGDDEVVLCNRSIERLVICNIERDWDRKLDAFREFLRALESSASWRKLAIVVQERTRGFVAYQQSLPRLHL
jgi:hypothetical protein